MKKNTWGMWAIAAAVACLCAACQTHRPVVLTPTGSIVVPHEPPAPRAETHGVAPSPNHVWIDGYWVHHNQRWTWVPGHWETRPEAGAIWVPGQWTRTSAGWTWRPGYWQ